MWLDDLRHDVVYALRASSRSRGFTAVAILTLAMGIGANTAIFSVVNTLMLRSLPVRNPEPLVELLFKYPKDPRMSSYRWTDYERMRDQNHVFSDLIAMSPARFQVTTGSSAPDVVDGVYVPGNFFDGLGVRAAAGRLIGPQDDRVGSAGAAAAVISWPYWQSRFNLDRSALGSSVVVNGVTATIVGVTPRDFYGLQLGMTPAVWVPVAMEPLTQSPSRLADRSLIVAVVGRLKPGVTRQQAQAEMRVLDKPRLEALEARGHDVQWRQVAITVEPAGAGLSTLRDRFGTSLVMMGAAVGILLLVACVNIASMLLARGAARRREMAVRVAIGAGRFRLVRQVLTESLLLSVAGGACGIIVAYLGGQALVAFIASGRSPVGMPQPLEIPLHLDGQVLLFAAACAVGTGLLFGLAPALNAFVASPSSSLRAVGGGGETPRWRRFGQSLVIAQVALSMVLLSGAALFVRYLTDLRSVGLGFQTASVLQVRLDWSRSGYTPAQMTPIQRELLDRVSAIAGVRSATLAGMTPISGAAGSQFITVSGFTEAAEKRRRVPINIVAPKYFETLGTPLIAGRDFNPDDEGRPRVAIVNQAMARYYFGSASPLGRQFTFDGQPRPLEIVGVVGDAKYWDLHEAPPPTIYQNALQGASPSVLVIRTNVPPMVVAADVRRALSGLLPNVPITRTTTLAEQIDASILPERLVAMLSQLFGALASILVAIGLYALLAYMVTRRLAEIGIRMAIGATTRDVSWLVLSRALRLVGAGLAVGIPAAVLAKGYADRVLLLVASAQVEAVSLDGGTAVPIGVAAIAMIVVALVASYVPVRRATAVDPITALRCE